MNHIDRGPGVRLVTDRPVAERVADYASDSDRIRADLEALAATLPKPTLLLEREHSGLVVEVIWYAETGEMKLHVEDGISDVYDVDIAPERALDAFNHPFCYLPR